MFLPRVNVHRWKFTKDWTNSHFFSCHELAILTGTSPILILHLTPFIQLEIFYNQYRLDKIFFQNIKNFKEKIYLLSKSDLNIVNYMFKLKKNVKTKFSLLSKYLWKSFNCYLNYWWHTFNFHDQFLELCLQLFLSDLFF